MKGEPASTPAPERERDGLPRRRNPGIPDTPPAPDAAPTRARRVIERAWHRLRTADRIVTRAVLAFLCIVLALTFLVYPYDTFNLRIFLFEGSYFAVSQTPYSVLFVPPPPNLQILSLGAFYAYSASGFHLLGAVLFYKATNAVLTVLCALLVGELVQRATGVRRWRTLAFAVTLLSPTVLFYSFVHLQLDVFGIFWTLLAVYLFTRASEASPGRLAFSIAGGVSLGYAIYAYVLPLAIVPTLLIYARSWRSRLLVLLTSGAGIAFFFLAYQLSGIYSPTNPVPTQGVTGTSYFSLPFVLGVANAAPWTRELYELWVVAVLVLAVFLRWYGARAMTSMLAAFVAALVILPIYNGDQFIWALPWVTLSLCEALAQPKWRWLWLGQLVILPEILAFNFFDGVIGMGTGIFYLSYPQFGNAYAVYAQLPNALFIGRVLMGMTFTGLILSVGLLAWLDHRTRSRRTRPVGTGSAPGAPAALSPSRRSIEPDRSATDGAPNAPRSRGRSRHWAVRVGVLLLTGIVLLALMPATFSAAAPPFPSGLFANAASPAGQVFNLSAGGTRAVLPPSSPQFIVAPLGFTRNTTYEEFSFVLQSRLLAPAGALYNLTFFASTHLNASVAASVGSVASWSAVSPTAQLDVAGARVVSYEWGDIPLAGMSFAGNGIASYNLAALPPGQSYSMFFHVASASFRQNVIWSLSTGKVTAELLAIETNRGTRGLVLGVSPAFNVWQNKVLSLDDTLQWDLVQFVPAGTMTEVWLDGSLVSTLPSVAGNVSLNVGRFSAARSTAWTDAFAGLTTSLLVSPGALACSTVLLIQPYRSGTVVVWNWSGQLGIRARDSSLELSANSSDWSTVNPDASFTFGRLSNTLWPLELTIENLTLASTSPLSPTLPVFLLLSLVAPIGMVTLPWWMGPRPGRSIRKRGLGP